MTRQEAIKWFQEELKDGKCSDDCLQCNANESALRSLEAWDKFKEEIEVYKSSLYTDDFDFYSGNMSALSAVECILEQLLQEVEE